MGTPSGIPHEGQAVPAPYTSYAPGRNRRGSANWHRLFPNLAIFMPGKVFKNVIFIFVPFGTDLASSEVDFWFCVEK